jgi:hypothetical protein
MNLFRRIDAFLIARLFQPIVNVSQRQPIWWAQQSAILMAVLLVMCGVLEGWAWPLVLAVCITVPAALLVSRSPVLLAWLGSWQFWRVMSTWMTVVSFALLLLVWWAVSTLGEPFPLPVLDNLSGLAQLSLMFFAACKPPPPRAPRTAPRLSLGGA